MCTFKIEIYARNFALICNPLPVTASATPPPAALLLFATGLGEVGLFGWRGKHEKRCCNCSYLITLIFSGETDASGL
jgi:hypothetical protein